MRGGGHMPDQLLLLSSQVGTYRTVKDLNKLVAHTREVKDFCITQL